VDGATDVRVGPEPLAIEAIVTGAVRPDCGAVATFVGVVRGETDGRRTEALEYEAHASLAEATLRELADRARERFDVRVVAIHHRTGRLAVGEVALVAAVSAPHRGPAREACAWLVESLKAEAPIWKKEIGPDGSFWVGSEA
jgi:molybdopterin synthase catalytic subunit